MVVGVEDHNASVRTADEAVTSSVGRLTWPSDDEREGRLYNISNFGDTASCYASVETGHERVFFLTLYEGRLSAQYDDLFGAVADWTSDNERQILHALGQSPASALSCSQTIILSVHAYILQYSVYTPFR